MNFHWSATTFAFDTQGAWFIDFTFGQPSLAPKTDALRVRAVRGAALRRAIEPEF